MSACVKQLTDDESTKVYPITKASAVYMHNGVDTVERILDDINDQDTEIEFTSTDITKTLASGSKVVTQFMDDGSIKETTTDENDVVLQVKTTTFNADGSISIVVEDSEEEGE